MLTSKKRRQTGDKRQKSRILASLQNGPLTVINRTSPDLGISGVNKRIAELRREGWPISERRICIYTLNLPAEIPGGDK